MSCIPESCEHCIELEEKLKEEIDMLTKSNIWLRDANSELIGESVKMQVFYDYFRLDYLMKHGKMLGLDWKEVMK